MSDKYFTVNIRAYLDKDEPTYIGEESLYDLLSDFSCPKNPDVEYFLLHNAIEFTKKDQSITYLVFDAEDASLVGYFSLTIKPISDPLLFQKASLQATQPHLSFASTC